MRYSLAMQRLMVSHLAAILGCGRRQVNEDATTRRMGRRIWRSDNSIPKPKSTLSTFEFKSLPIPYDILGGAQSPVSAVASIVYVSIEVDPQTLRKQTKGDARF
jgi:hypothetical protein